MKPSFLISFLFFSTLSIPFFLLFIDLILDAGVYEIFGLEVQEVFGSNGTIVGIGALLIGIILELIGVRIIRQASKAAR